MAAILQLWIMSPETELEQCEKLEIRHLASLGLTYCTYKDINPRANPDMYSEHVLSPTCCSIMMALLIQCCPPHMCNSRMRLFLWFDGTPAVCGWRIIETLYTLPEWFASIFCLECCHLLGYIAECYTCEPTFRRKGSWHMWYTALRPRTWKHS
jgi:hypothetical protein